MSGKVFRGGDHTAALCPCREGCGESRHIRRVFSVRANIDHGIAGIVVHINDRRVDLLYTQGASFTSSYLTLPPRIFRITGRCHCHVPGKVHRIVKTHSRACFQISRNQQRVLRQLLHAIDQHHGFVNRTLKENDAAHLIVDNLMAKRAKSIAVLVQVSGVNANGDKLADLLVERHPSQLFVSPLNRILARRRGIWLNFPRRNGRMSRRVNGGPRYRRNHQGL